MTNTSKYKVNNPLAIAFMYAPAVVSVAATGLKFWDLFGGSVSKASWMDNAAAAIGTFAMVYLHIAAIDRLMNALNRSVEHFENDNHGKAGLGVFMIGFFGIIECFFNYFGISHFLQKVEVSTYGAGWWIFGGALALVICNAFSKFFYSDGQGRFEAKPNPPARAPINLNADAGMPNHKDAPRIENNVHQLLTSTAREIEKETPRKTFSWTQQAQADLKRLLADGLTRAQAAIALGTTENSVDGACTRYNISKGAIAA